MASKRPSPLDPGAYGKAQRWHRILTDAARARAEKREEQRQRADEAANTSMLSSAAAAIMSVFR
jgi:hypothetical protein